MATRTFTNVRVKAAEVADTAVATGVAAAAMVSGGAGVLMIGLLTTGAEISAGLKELLNWTDPVGPLSGKTGVGIVAWLVSWFLLNTIWKEKDYDLRKAFLITLVLISLGVLLTFPPFFQAFEK